jgi:glycosyltransferase involved in cell wall biosynthesis
MLVENQTVPTDSRVWPECLTLRNAGFRVVVVCPEGRDFRAPFERLEGIEIHRYPPAAPSAGIRGFTREYGAAFWRIARMTSKLARRQRFDVVHVANPPDFLLLTALPLRARGTRFIFDQHDLVPELYAERFGARSDVLCRANAGLERLAFGLADVVIGANESFRRVAITRGRKSPDDVFVVRNAPDADRVRPVEPDPELRRGKRHLIAYVGLMGPQDGVEHAVRALALLRERRTDWHALFVGDGPVLESLQALAVELGLEQDIEFAGYVRDHDWIVRALSSADVCLAPEPKNPLNDASTLIKVAEYMATGTPLVAYDLVETRFTAGEAAAYAEADDPKSFALRIDELLSDPARRAEMGSIGRARVEERFSWAHSERELLAAYERALHRSGALAVRSGSVARTAPSTMDNAGLESRR